MVSSLLLAEVLGRYSNLGPAGVKLAKASEAARRDRRAEPWVASDVRVTKLRRMTPDVIEAMIADYRSGIGSWRLAKKYDVSDSTVLARLKAAGVPLDATRGQSQRIAVTEEMRRLREEGWTLVAIGEKFGVTRQTLSMRLSRGN